MSSETSMKRLKRIEAETPEETVQNPCIFQCAQCFRVVGDDKSYKAECVSGDDTFVVLSDATNVAIADRETKGNRISKDDCVFVKVLCECGCDLGRMYLATKDGMDFTRDMYSLNVGKLYCYTYGTNFSKSTRAASEKSLSDAQNDLRQRQAKMQAAILTLQNNLNSAIKYYESVEATVNDASSRTKRGRGRGRVGRPPLSTRGRVGRPPGRSRGPGRPRKYPPI